MGQLSAHQKSIWAAHVAAHRNSGLTQRSRRFRRMPLLGRQWLCAVLQVSCRGEISLASPWRGAGIADGATDQLVA